MELLPVMRALTLAGRIGLVGALLYVAAGPFKHVHRTVRGSWGVVAGQHVILALTTALIEVVWVVWAVAPRSPFVSFALPLYNSLYHFNATVTAVVPYLIVALLAGTAAQRRSAALAAVVVGGLGVVTEISGATRDWGVLMSWSQVFAFVQVGGYLVFWGCVILGRVRRPDAYLLGFLAVEALYAILLPIQAEFFEFVGRARVAEIWHVHAFLQLALVAIQLTIAVACIGVLRGLREGAAAATVGGGVWM